MTTPQVTPGGLVGYAGVCPDCGKLRFPSKRAGRAVRRAMHDQLSVYRCGEYWHVGHLPEPVLRGLITRDQIGEHPRTDGIRVYRPVQPRPKYWPGQPNEREEPIP